MLLSIVMMVKNEENNLNRTLSSLRKLRENIESELIILDTGSEDDTVNIAREHTDKIYYCAWNNNFSDMRNKSISYAKGKWILILDADEELIDCDEIVQFFTTNKYKKYNSGLVFLRNLSSKNDLNNYKTIKLLRLFKRDKDFKYTSAIHEQPLYKYPIYEKVLAEFNHYGYIYEDEEFRNYKVERNGRLLLEEYKNNPNDPYINFQLGKNYITSRDIGLACEYLEKSLKLYKSNNILAEYVYQYLAIAYLRHNEMKSCEKICLEYIDKIDKNNIDIYYFLGKSQMKMCKFDESKVNYEKYLYLLDNYQFSTQNKSFYCEGTTINLKEDAVIELIEIYNNLERYEDVIDYYDEYLRDTKRNNGVNLVLINALYKMKNIEKIKEYYKYICKTQSDRNEFIMSIESFMLTIDKRNREEIISELLIIDGNYQTLNKIRLNKEDSIDIYKSVLLNVKESYYGDIIYFAVNKSFDLIYLLEGIDTLYLQKFLEYIVNNRRDIILNLYDYLYNAKNTLDIDCIKVYMCIARSLLKYGNIIGDKAKTLFYMYKSYTYFYVKSLYNPNFKDEELQKLVVDLDFKFIIKFNIISKLKKNDKIKYIRDIKDLIIEYPKYSKYINLIIEEYKSDKEENIELESLRERYKTIIKNNINDGFINEAINMIKEYEDIFKEDINILNMKAVIEIMKEEYEKADDLLKELYLMDNENYDIVYNIAFTKERLGYLEEAYRFYNVIINYSEDEILLNDVKNKMTAIESRKNKIRNMG